MPLGSTMPIFSGRTARKTSPPVRRPMAGKALWSPRSRAAPASFTAATSRPRVDASATLWMFAGGVPINWAVKRLPHSLYISRVEPTCSIRPSFMTTMRSASAIASAWSCVTKMVVAPVFRCISFRKVRTDTRSLASRFESGSSISESFELTARARATATLCRCPPESCAG